MSTPALGGNGGGRHQVVIVVRERLVGELLARTLVATRAFDVRGLHVDGDPRLLQTLEAGADLVVLAVDWARARDRLLPLLRRDPAVPVLVLGHPEDRPVASADLNHGPAAYVDLVGGDCGALIDAALLLAQSGASAAAGNHGPLSIPGTPSLSRREREVLGYMALGMDNLKIAALLGISERAVKVHVTSLYRKLGCENRAELALYSVYMGAREISAS